ncbi:Histone acetyltransferase [Trichostrongylus colubriformis]|uniref:histone acetyltransferase n=1 Tax=Trichostrongylus colubriformis TaxID=6319 RepID=A0AAN8FRI3_TRICO
MIYHYSEMPRHTGGSGVVKEKDKDKDGTKEKSHSKEKYAEKSDRKAHTDNERVGPSSSRRVSESERKHSVRPTDELKLLQDSLTQFFTPSAGRRCRQPPRKFDESGVNSDDSVHHHIIWLYYVNDVIVCKGRDFLSNLSSIQKPLTVDVESKAECVGSSTSTRSVTSEPSPSRKICEKLVDSLSPYFSTSSEKRRTTQKGEFAQLNSGRTRSERSPPRSSPQSPSSTREVKFETTEPVSPSKQMASSSTRGRRTEYELQPVVGGRGTQNSASAALFSSPSSRSSGVQQRTRSSSKSQSPPVKRVRTPKLPHTPQGSPRKSRSGRRRSSFTKAGISADETTEEDDETTAAELSEREGQASSKMRNKRKAVKNGHTVRNDDVLACTASPSGEKENYQSVDKEGKIRITEQAQRMFDAVQSRAQESIDKAIREIASTTMKEPSDEPRWPLAIRIGSYEISTWYNAPYPQEYAHVPILHICEFCLKYMKTEAILAQHMKKCEWRHPPGNEIYRNNNVSVFEVDGNVSRIYCQNLCLIAKLFLDHKTLYYDVEPFLFYVVTKNDEYGFHLVGYFSKEKYSQQKFNLSCIVTLPCYQKQGFGRFLIDFSFLLSRREHMMGTPERPLSDLGRISYASYWRTALFEYIHEHVPKNTKKIMLTDLAKGTGIAVHDIVEVFDALRWFQKQNGSVGLVLNWTMIDAHWKKVKADKTRIWLNESALKWSPSVYTPSKDFAIRSPIVTPSSPNQNATITSTPSGVSLAAVGSTIKKGAAPLRSCRKVTAARRLKLDGSTAGGGGGGTAHAVNSGGRRTLNKVVTTTEEETSSSSSEEEDPKTRRGCRVDTSKATGSAARKKAPTSVSMSNGRKAANGASGSLSRRGKAVFEEDDSGTNSPSTSSGSDSDDLDVSFHIGKKPQKGKVPPTQRKKRPAPRKPPIKSPGKVFPGNYGQRSPPKAAAVTASPLPSAARDAVSSTAPHCDSPTTSVGTAATVPMRLGDAAIRCSPGGGRTLQDVEADEEVAAIVATPPPPDRPQLEVHSTPPVGRSGTGSQAGLRADRHHPKEGKSTTASSADTSEHSDVDHSHAPTESSRSASSCSSHGPVGVDSPRPLGDRIPVHGEAVNMGGVPDDDDGYSRCAPSEESDHPPQLQAEAAIIAGSGGGGSSDEAPPCLHQGGPAPSGSAPIGDAPPLHEDYATDDDDAPPQLSPANIEPVTLPPEREMTEEEKQKLAMDRPPKAPAMLDKVNDEEQELQRAVISRRLQFYVNNDFGITWIFLAGHIHDSLACAVYAIDGTMLLSAIPTASYYAVATVSRNMCAQPSSVSSVHSTHNSSLEMASGAGPSSQAPYASLAPLSVNASTVHSDPSTPLRPSCQAYPAAYPTHFDPTAAGFPGANPYWQTGYPHYAAAKGPAMGSMMPANPAAFPYPYPNGMAPVNGRSQSAAGAWPRYPQGMTPFGGAAGNPAGFPVGPSATDFMFNSAAAGYFSNGAYPFNIAK